jgi:hypothetical protein
VRFGAATRKCQSKSLAIMILSRKTRPPIGLTVGDEILHESGEKVETGARFGAHPDVYLSENTMVSLEAQSHKLSDNVPSLALL